MNSYLVCLIVVSVVCITQGTACKSGWSGSGGKCYKAFTASKTQANAKAACKKEGAYLAEPKTTAANEFIRSLIGGQSFIGYAKTGDAFLSIKSGTSPCYCNWNAGEPNNSSGDENCVEMYIDPEKKGVWNDIPCTVTRRYVCEY